MTTIKKIEPRAFLKLDTPRFKYIQDPGHGWIKAHKDLVQVLGFQDQITSYSYHDQDYYYLEEDCDAALLINALKNKNIQYELEEDHINYDSFIRSLPNVKGVR